MNGQVIEDIFENEIIRNSAPAKLIVLLVIYFGSFTLSE